MVAVVVTVVVVVVVATLRGEVELGMVDVLRVICGGVARNETETTERCKVNPPRSRQRAESREEIHDWTRETSATANGKVME